MRCLTRSLAFVVLCAAAVPAQTTAAGPSPKPPSIRASGDASVLAKPDRAIVDIAVVTEAPTAQAAAAQNATRLDAVVRAVSSAAPAAELKTAGYSLDPNFRYPKPGGQPELAGYTARNTVQVTTADLASAGTIIDASTRSGANSIDRLQFTLKDDVQPRAEALRQAAVKARAAAEAIASALGVKLARVLSAEEEGGATSPVQPMFKMARMAESVAAPATAVTPGTIEVHAAVTLTFEIAQ
jgi:uncharacterized protein YggE